MQLLGNIASSILIGFDIMKTTIWSLNLTYRKVQILIEIIELMKYN